MSQAAVRVDPVDGRRDRRAFRLLPHRLYTNDPFWVAPPNMDMARFLHPKRKHAFYESGDIRWMLARKDDRVVGRIAAIENRAHNAHHGDRTGFFGFFEAENDPQVAKVLLDAAATWAADRGLKTLRGPTSPSLNYESGCLVDGDPGAPFLMMPHNPPWYAALIEANGFTKVMDLYAFLAHEDHHDIERWLRIGDKILKRNQVSLRPFDTGRFDEDVHLIIDVFNDAWSRNWGFVPLSERETAALAKELRPVFLPSLCSFLVRDGESIGFWMGLPDYNRVLLKLRGRLLPFGFLKLLRAKRRLDTMRVMLMGIRKEHQHRGLDAALYGDIIRANRSGIRSAECSWILETNTPMINTLERAGARRWRTYRIYDKPLTP